MATQGGRRATLRKDAERAAKPVQWHAAAARACAAAGYVHPVMEVPTRRPGRDERRGADTPTVATQVVLGAAPCENADCAVGPARRHAAVAHARAVAGYATPVLDIPTRRPGRDERRGAVTRDAVKPTATTQGRRGAVLRENADRAA